MENYLELLTTDNAKVFIKPESIDGIEEVPGTARTESIVKIYVRGYSFKLKMNLEELVALLK